MSAFVTSLGLHKLPFGGRRRVPTGSGGKLCILLREHPLSLPKFQLPTPVAGCDQIESSPREGSQKGGLRDWSYWRTEGTHWRQLLICFARGAASDCSLWSARPDELLAACCAPLSRQHTRAPSCVANNTRPRPPPLERLVVRTIGRSL